MCQSILRRSDDRLTAATEASSTSPPAELRNCQAASPAADADDVDEVSTLSESRWTSTSWALSAAVVVVVVVAMAYLVLSCLVLLYLCKEARQKGEGRERGQRKERTPKRRTDATLGV